MQTSVKENLGINELLKVLAESYYQSRNEKNELRDLKIDLEKKEKKENKKEGNCCLLSNKEETRKTDSTTSYSTI